jgi:hypothetical protein
LQTTSQDVATLSGYLLLEQRFGRIDADARPELAATSLIGSARGLKQWNLSGEKEVIEELLSGMVAMLLKGIASQDSEDVARARRESMKASAAQPQDWGGGAGTTGDGG